jgi:hypothetical protein
MASFLILMFVNWHSRKASCMAAHVECWRSICTCIPLGINTGARVRELEKRDVRHVECSRWFRDVITASGGDIMDVTFFTNEACFHLSGYISSQNSCVWSATNLHEIKDTPVHDQEVGVWCVISQNWVIDPILFITSSTHNVIVK